MFDVSTWLAGGDANRVTLPMGTVVTSAKQVKDQAHLRVRGVALVSGVRLSACGPTDGC